MRWANLVIAKILEASRLVADQDSSDFLVHATIL